MKTKKILVNSMFKNILTAGTVAFAMIFGFTACSDELANESSERQSDEIPAGADTRLLEAYGLMYNDFESDNDVQILNEDTTEIAVSKQLADKLGITSFVGHPMGIWQAVDQLPYARKAIEERLVGDTYILKVQTATVAELIGDKSAQLSTAVYVNNNPHLMKRPAANNFSSFGAKYVDETGIIHPAVIHLTDPNGYDQPYHNETDEPALTRSASGNGHYDYITADELASGELTRGGLGASMHVNVLSIHDKLSFRHKFEMEGAPTDTIVVSGQVPIDYDLNYFMTLEGGVKWDGWLPSLYVKKFETGLDGDFAFKPEAYLSFAARVELKKAYERLTLATFGQYTFTFVVGVVPVCITVKPSLYLKFTANAEGGVRVGFKYDYASQFKAGIRYQNGWSVIKDFEELRNKFEFYKPEANFTANAGIGFYLGVDVLVYGVAGPEVGVGPELMSKASATYRPLEDDPDKRFDFNASVDLMVKAFAGAKISLLGYELAKWSTEMQLAGPWTLFKYPSDGTEHKDPDKQKQEDKNAFWKDKVLPVLNTISGRGDFYENYEKVVNEIIDMDKLSRQDAISTISNTVLATYNIATINLNDYNTQLGLWSKYIGLEIDTHNRYNTYIRVKNMEDIIEMVKASEQYRLYNAFIKYWGERIEFDKISEEFEKRYGRLPECTASDVMTVLNMTLAYSEIYYNNQYDAKSVYTYLMNHVYERNCWTPKAARVRAAYETILLWKKGYGKNVAGKENWENMADDFNSLIVDIYQLNKQGIEI
jgi:hypothetical protein